MKDILNQIKSLYKKLNVRKVSYEVSGIMPSRDWFIILISSQVIILILAVASVFFYYKVDRGEIFKVEDLTAEGETKINMTVLDALIKEINTKEQNTTIVRQRGEIPSDPSI